MKACARRARPTKRCARICRATTTPELFLYAALSDYQLYEDMKRAVAEMLRKQPDNEDVKTLDAWLKTRVK